MPIVVSTPTLDLPVTVGDLITATRDHLQGTYRSEWKTLGVAMAASTPGATETITLSSDFDGAVRTAYLAIDDEIVYVLSNPAANQCQVIRGFDGTQATAHDVNAYIEVSPRFPRNVIRRQLSMEILSWPDNLFQVKRTSFQTVFDGRTFAYDIGITSDQVHYLLDVRHSPFSTRDRNTWPHFRQPCRLNRSVDIVSFPSGMALEIHDSDMRGQCEVVVTYAAPFDLSNFVDEAPLSTIGLVQSLFDIAPLGAAARLIGPHETMRTFSEAADSEANYQQVQAGAALRVAMYLQSRRDQRVKEEMEHFQVAWPWRIK